MVSRLYFLFLTIIGKRRYGPFFFGPDRIMKKKSFLVLMMTLVVSASLVTGCSKKDAADVEGTEISTETATSDIVPEQQGQLLPSGLENTYLDYVGSLVDPWSGVVGIGSLYVEPSNTYADVLSMMASGYNEIYAMVDGVQSVGIDDSSMSTQSGRIEVAFAPDGITNVQDTRVIRFLFSVAGGVPDGVPVSEYKLDTVMFNVHDNAGNETGVGLTVPEYQDTVLTRADLKSAFGEGFVIGEISSSIEFNNQDSPLFGISAEYDSSDRIVRVMFEFDVDYDESGSAGDAADYGVFSDFYDASVNPGSYFGVYPVDGNAMYAFVSEDGSGIADSKAYSVNVWGIHEGEFYNYGTVGSSMENQTPLRISTDGQYLYCADVGVFVKIWIDSENGQLVAQKQVVASQDDAGNAVYDVYDNGEFTGTVTESADWDAISDEYAAAQDVVVYQK